MEEILHHLGCKNHVNNGIFTISTGAGTNSVEDLAFSELSLKHMKSHAKQKPKNSETSCIEV